MDGDAVTSVSLLSSAESRDEGLRCCGARTGGPGRETSSRALVSRGCTWQAWQRRRSRTGDGGGDMRRDQARVPLIQNRGAAWRCRGDGHCGSGGDELSQVWWWRVCFSGGKEVRGRFEWRGESVSRSMHASKPAKGELLFAVTYTSVLPSFTRTGTATFRGEDGGAGGTLDPKEEPVFAVAELLLWMLPLL